MSEFSHIEITIETVATDGTRTRTTRWTCPSVEMGSTRDQRVQLRFAGEPVVVAGPAVEARPESARELVRRLTAEACAEVRAAIGDEWGSRPLREGIGEMRRRMIAAENAVAAYRKRDAEQGPAVVAGEAPIAHSTWPRTSTADALMALRGAERDVATDPRVGDRVTVGGWLRTVEAVEPGRILVYSGPRFYWRPEEWVFLCQMPGAVIERAPE